MSSFMTTIIVARLYADHAYSRQKVAPKALMLVFKEEKKIKKWIDFSMEKFHENHINKMHVLQLTKNNFSSKTDKTDYPLVPVA